VGKYGSCSACSHDASFVVRIASGSALVCGFRHALASGVCLCFQESINAGMRESLGTVQPPVKL